MWRIYITGNRMWSSACPDLKCRRRCPTTISQVGRLGAPMSSVLETAIAMNGCAGGQADPGVEIRHEENSRRYGVGNIPRACRMHSHRRETEDAALGALSGAIVLGPIGAVAGAAVGYAAGPAIASTWGLRRSDPPHRARFTQATPRRNRMASVTPRIPLPRTRPIDAVEGIGQNSGSAVTDSSKVAATTAVTAPPTASPTGKSIPAPVASRRSVAAPSRFAAVSAPSTATPEPSAPAPAVGAPLGAPKPETPLVPVVTLE